MLHSLQQSEEGMGLCEVGMLYTTKAVYLIPGFSSVIYASIKALQGAGHQIEEVMVSLGGETQSMIISCGNQIYFQF